MFQGQDHIRPIEREVEHEENEEGMIPRKYCLAVRSALTDDGHPPLSAAFPQTA
jgi:hypothetical protein